MIFRSALTLVIGLAVLVGVSKTANSDPQAAEPAAPVELVPPAAAPETALQKEGALQEILRIRQKLGGSVLKGSVLDQPNQTDLPFDAGLRDRLGLPDQKPNGSEASSTPSQTPNQTPGQIVVNLRRQSTELDRIANEIEVMRAYKNADSLRETAKQLRLIARQFDTEKKPTVDRISREVP